MTLSRINKEELDKLTESLIVLSSEQLRTDKHDKHDKQLSYYIDKLITVTHLFPANYIGIEGRFSSNDIKKLWYYYRYSQKVDLDKYALSEDNLKLVQQYNEDDEDILQFLKPFFDKLKTGRSLLNIMTVHLSETELNQYTELIKLVQGKDNVNVDRKENCPELKETLINKNTLTEQIQKLSQYNTSYLMVTNPIEQPYTLLQISANNADANEINDEIYTLIKVINLPI